MICIVASPTILGLMVGVRTDQLLIQALILSVKKAHDTNAKRG